MYVVYDGVTGEYISASSQELDPERLRGDQEALVITEEQYTGITTGKYVWNSTTRALDTVLDWIDPAVTQQEWFDREDRLATSIENLRQWADQAEATTVTSGNAVATLQTVVTRLGVFFDRFADLLEQRPRRVE
jgi:hypothetical protein